MSVLADVIEVAQQNTWVTVVLLWFGAAAGYRSLKADVRDLDGDLETVAEDQDDMAEQVNRVDQCQNRIEERQERILERMGMNAEDIQELKTDQARLEERYSSDEGDTTG